MPKRYLDLRGKTERALEAKQHNTRERNIAKEYINAGPSIGNLAKAAYHWYNSVPWLGGENEKGNVLIGGYPEVPGINNVNIVRRVGKAKKVIDAARATAKQWDKAYFDALKEGNIREAQRLRDLHFITKSKTVVKNENGTPIKTYHTVGDKFNPNFNSFNTNIEGFDSAIYTAKSPIMSGTYTNKLVSNAEKDFYINTIIENELNNIKEGAVKGELAKLRYAALSNPNTAKSYIQRKVKWLNDNVEPIRQKPLYVRLINPVKVNNGSRNWNNIDISQLPKDVYDNLHSTSMLGYSTRDIERAQKSLGHYDGAIIDDVVDYGSSLKSLVSPKNSTTVYQINNPKNIKSSKYITRDDSGNIIPLSQRDNFNINDIRYGFVPIIGLSAASLYKDKKKYGGIHIAPSKRGTFTAAATKHGMGVQEFAARVLRNKDNYSPSLVKKANFARNASKWNH